MKRGGGSLKGRSPCLWWEGAGRGRRQVPGGAAHSEGFTSGELAEEAEKIKINIKLNKNKNKKWFGLGSGEASSARPPSSAPGKEQDYRSPAQTLLEVIFTLSHAQPLIHSPARRKKQLLRTIPGLFGTWRVNCTRGRANGICR